MSFLGIHTELFQDKIIDLMSTTYINIRKQQMTLWQNVNNTKYRKDMGLWMLIILCSTFPFVSKILK